MRILTIVLSLIAVSFCQAALAADFSEGAYQLRIGDIDNDGDDDVFVEAVDNVVIIHSEVTFPLVLGIKPFVLAQTSGGEFELDNAPSQSDVSLAKSWPVSTTQLVLEDINLDGLSDLVLKDLETLIVGVNDVVIFAPTVGRSPRVIKNLDADTVQFFSDNFKWLMDPSYYGTGVFIQCYIQWVNTFGIVGYDLNGYPTFGYYLRPILVCQYGFNASLFSSAALEMAVSLDRILRNGSLTAGSDDAKIIESVFQNVLGTVFFNGYLGSATTTSIPSDVSELPDVTLPDDMDTINVWKLFKLLRGVWLIFETNDLDDYLSIHHYTTEAGFSGIAASGIIAASDTPNGPYTYLTNDLYATGSQAMDSLALCGDERIGFYALVQDEIGGLSYPPNGVEPWQCDKPNDDSYRPGGGTETKKSGNQPLTSRWQWIPIVRGK